MDPGSPVLEWMDLFDSQGRQHSMELDGLSGVSLSGLDDNGLAFNLAQPLGGFPGQDLVATALRTQPDAEGRLSVPTDAIRPSVSTLPDASGSAAQPMHATVPAAAGQMIPPPPAQYSIKPMPARKTVACKPVTVVKQEPAVDQQPPQTKQVAQTKQAAQAKQVAQAKQQLKQQQKSAQQLQQELRELQEEADAAAFDSDSEDPSSATGGGKRRRRIRNAKQQELNRLAQQRYRERRKAKYSTLQDTVEELSGRLGQLSTLEAANNELSTRNTQLELVVKEQNTQLQAQKDTITRQAQQLQTQAVQLGAQAKQLQTQVSVIQQQDKTLQELRTQLAAADSSNANNAAAPGSPKAGGSDAEQLNEQIALAVRAVLTGVSSMACLGTPAGKDAAQMQQMVGQLPDALLQQIRSCCREVALHLKKTEVKEQPHAITVPCC